MMNTGKCKLKTQLHLDAHQLECVKLETLMKPKLARMWRNWNSHILQVGMYMHIIPVETVCLLLKKLKIHLLYDPATLFLEIKIYVQRFIHKCS